MDLRSGCRRQIILVATAPIKEILIISGIMFDIIFLLDDIIIRIIPYPPNFRRIAASTIDPAIGASTCAFGSHKCIVNMGSFTKNPIIMKSENIKL